MLKESIDPSLQLSFRPQLTKLSVLFVIQAVLKYLSNRWPNSLASAHRWRRNLNAHHRFTYKNAGLKVYTPTQEHLASHTTGSRAALKLMRYWISITTPRQVMRSSQGVKPWPRIWKLIPSGGGQMPHAECQCFFGVPEIYWWWREDMIAG